MEFVVFLAAYLARRKLDSGNLWASETWWRKFFARAHQVSPGKESGLSRGLVWVMAPALLLGLGEFALRHGGWSLAVHPLALVLLLGLMGTPGLGALLDNYTQAWRRGDMQGAWHRVQYLLPARDRGAASSPEQLHKALAETVVGLIFERYFVIVFWYVVAGLGGAFAAAGLIALREHWPHASARPGFGGIANVVNWLPARLLAFTFGVAGDLAGWLRGGKSAVLSPGGDNQRLLMDAVSSSLTGYELEPGRLARVHARDWPEFGERSLAAIRGLLNRSMLVWICGLALLVIAGVV